MVGGGAVVVTGGCVVVVVAGAVVDVDEVGGANVDGGCVGTATFSLDPPSSRSARNAMLPMIQSASTAPATMRAAVTYCVPVRSPRDRLMRSAARAASTNATIVPMTGMTMLTTAQTSAAIANGSTRASPQPPGPPEPPAPVGSGSGPTGTAVVSSGFHSSGSCGGSEADIRGTLPTLGHELVLPR